MKKLLALILSVILSICCFSVGVIELGKEVALRDEKRRIYKFDEELTQICTDVNSRLIVNSNRHNLDSCGAIGTASGYDNTYIFQYESREKAQKAYEYFNSLGYVNSVFFDVMGEECGIEILDNDDARCYGSANDYVDDMIKLMKANYDCDNLPEVKVGVIDTGCMDNEVTHNRVEYLDKNIDEEDGNSHGSHSCSTIIYNTFDNVRVYNYDHGQLGIAKVASLLNKARVDRCKIVNMSWCAYNIEGQPLPSNLETAIDGCYNAGMIVVASAGNDKMIFNSSSTVLAYPAVYNNVFGIAAMDTDNEKASFSNYGRGINFFAGGVGVRAYFQGEEVFWRGTSAAAPLTSAIFANICSIFPNITFSQLKSAIKINGLRDGVGSYINAYKTLSELTNKTLPQAEFSYDLSRNDDGSMKITFHCDDDIRIYCNKGVAGGSKNPASTYGINYNKDCSVYYNGDSLNWDENKVVSAVAYGDNYRKSKERVITVSHLGSGYTFDKSKGEISYSQNVTDKEIIVPSEIEGVTVKTIAQATFAGNNIVESIVVPASVTTISPYAFACCANLKKVVLLGVSTLDIYLFEDCHNLEFVFAPNTTRANRNVFWNCTQLKITGFKNLNVYQPNTFQSNDSRLCESKTSHRYYVYSLTDNSVSYKCSLCNNDELLTLSADYLKSVWSPYTINFELDYINYNDSLQLFDVNGDKIINAKDYAIINKLSNNYN